ncbi:hypothetical protein FRC20_005049 [Serendipita sp. 405]|nr:hypothetical protein FRC20_005049 [Serendipita sp. 405]
MAGRGRDGIEVVLRTPEKAARPRSNSEGESAEVVQYADSAKEGALNIRGVVIHILGDALGSIGVVVSGLIIWFLKSKARFYVDPALSLAITFLIMWSAIPLVRSAGFILLQGVPSSISLRTIHSAIGNVPGVGSVHELHIWQLSETRLIASVHIKVDSTRPYMDIVRDVKKLLHANGIHSGTVQPEIGDDESDTKVCTYVTDGLLRTHSISFYSVV